MCTNRYCFALILCVFFVAENIQAQRFGIEAYGTVKRIDLDSEQSTDYFEIGSKFQFLFGDIEDLKLSGTFGLTRYEGDIPVSFNLNQNEANILGLHFGLLVEWSFLNRSFIRPKIGAGLNTSLPVFANKIREEKLNIAALGFKFIRIGLEIHRPGERGVYFDHLFSFGIEFGQVNGNPQPYLGQNQVPKMKNPYTGLWVSAPLY